MLQKIALSLFCAFATALSAAEFTIEEVDDGVVINIDGKLFTKYVTGDEISNKPYFYPVVGPAGVEMTRAYPMKDVEGERQDHPHHRSLYFGHQFINDNDTWHERLTLEERAKGDEAKLAKMLETLGASVHRKIVTAAAEGDHAVLKVETEYRNAAGGKMVEDVRTFTFRVAENGSRIIDADIEFIGTEETVKFGDAKDAGFSVRVAHAMCVDAKQGGRIVNSAGDVDKEAWGKRAAWCDFHGPIGSDGGILGVAILNHPKSFRHPTPWHARTYGLFTANPFGLKTVAREEKDSAVELKKGEKLTLRHRVILHAGDEKAAGIAKAFEAYAKEK
ncbi:MAG: hypothetical protein ACI8UO_004717 [Verrucomicrobiales bacterium]|jgi:hypothetical protein